jgi:hypothetical protein
VTMGKRKRAKRAWKPSVRPPALHAGDVRGELRVIEYTGKSDKQGHRFVLVVDVKTGERRTVRADNLASGNTTSDGGIKKARYREMKAKEKAEKEGRKMNMDDLDPELLVEAGKLTGDDVDSRSGEKVSAVKKSGVWDGLPDKFGMCRHYVILRGQLLCCSRETKGKYLPVTAELENGGRIITAQELSMKEETPVNQPALEAPPVPCEQTETGFNALQAYWNVNKKVPPENFDLRQWFAGHRLNFRKPA